MERELAREIDGELCLSTRALAQAMGVSQQALATWEKRGCPKAQYGWWPLKAVLAWRGEGKADGEMSDAAMKIKQDGRLKQLQADNLEMKNALARGDYVSRVEISTTLQRFFGEFKRDARAFSRSITMLVAPYVDPVTARKVGQSIDDNVSAFLRRVADGMKHEQQPTRRKKTG